MICTSPHGPLCHPVQVQAIIVNIIIIQLMNIIY